MTKQEAIARLREAAEDEDMSDEAEELFEAMFERKPDPDDGDLGELISHAYAALHAHDRANGG
jgi:hypothetical protein